MNQRQAVLLPPEWYQMEHRARSEWINEWASRPEGEGVVSLSSLMCGRGHAVDLLVSGVIREGDYE